MKRSIFSLILIFACVAFVPQAEAKRPAEQAKYVFYFIGDGMGLNQVYGTELYNAHLAGDATKGRLSFTSFPLRSYVTNSSSSSLVTDSSAAGTALATGENTNNSFMGVDSQERRLESIAELAVRSGMGAGLVTNVEVNHATPASFYAHSKRRNDYGKLLQDMLQSKIQFMAGSTLRVKHTKHKTDYYIAEARRNGITVTTSLDEAAQADGRVVLLADTLGHSMKYAIDRTEGDRSVVDFTKSAISYLDRHFHKEGFFLMVEGGKIDYACHSNDAVTMFQEINDFSESIALALEFARRYPDQTLIVVTADHETGGFSVGYRHYKMNIERIVGQTCSESTLSTRMQEHIKAGNTDWESMKALLRESLGLWECASVSEKEEASLRRTFEKCIAGEGEKVVDLYSTNEKLAAQAVKMVNNKAKFAWTSLSHTGMQVPLYATGVGTAALQECYDNTDIPKAIARVMGLQLPTDKK